MRVLVTGAAGFIGSRLVTKLLQNDFEVVGIDDLSAGTRTRLPSNFDLTIADLNTLSIFELTEILSRVDFIFHLAAIKKHNLRSDFDNLVNTNFHASRKLFVAAREAGVKKIIYTSSLYAYGSLNRDYFKESDLPQSLSYYGSTKYFAEHALNLETIGTGIQQISARLFFTYGPNQYASGGYMSVIERNLLRALNGEPLQIYGSGSQTMDFLFVDDLCLALIELAKSPFHGTVNIGSGLGVTISEVISEISLIYGGLAIERLAPDWTEGSRRVASIDLLNSIIDFKPRITLAQGLRLMVDEIGRGKITK